jgi:threonine synthase
MQAPAYRSTRYHTSDQTVSFKAALLQGLAPDGGLYVPTAIPKLEPRTWTRAAGFSCLATEVMSRWVGEEIPRRHLQPLIEDALNFPVPLVPLKPAGSAGEGVYLLELFHGPTLSFKDFGARTMARLMSHFLKENHARLTILAATSGDTGSAVADGFAGQEHIDVVLMYPKGQVSPVQERQLTAARPGVRTFAVEGSFDDCQQLAKEAFTDASLRHLSLSSANSINIGRLLPQSLYYMWAVARGGFQAPNICVPSGNLGNLTAGLLAALGGLPVHRFIAAHNANDFFPGFLAGMNRGFRSSVRTISNAMDVGAPSNFERLQALLDGDEM